MIKVINPGIFTTVQDLGRRFFRAFGVPKAGAMDEFSSRVANMLVGNDENAPLLELTIVGGSYLFEEDTLIALTGADMSATCAGRALANWQSHFIRAGQQLDFSFATKCCRAYLAVAGGICVEKVMDSCSTHTRAKLGGFDGRALKAGDVLQVGVTDKSKLREIPLPEDFRFSLPEVPVIRVLPGPQADSFTPDTFDVMQSDNYTIALDSDRMGYRLSGNILSHNSTGADIVSDALIEGAVQVPGDGQPIIMLSDCQTTGGYTKLCFVISSDLPILGQCRPGDQIRFKLISEEEALDILQEYQKKLDKIRMFLKK